MLRTRTKFDSKKTEHFVKKRDTFHKAFFERLYGEKITQTKHKPLSHLGQQITCAKHLLKSNAVSSHFIFQKRIL